MVTPLPRIQSSRLLPWSPFLPRRARPGFGPHTQLQPLHRCPANSAQIRLLARPESGRGFEVLSQLDSGLGFQGGRDYWQGQILALAFRLIDRHVLLNANSLANRLLQCPWFLPEAVEIWQHPVQIKGILKSDLLAFCEPSYVYHQSSDANRFRAERMWHI